MSTLSELINSIHSGSKWDVGVSINRTNPVPLDATAALPSLDDLKNYAAGENVDAGGKDSAIKGAVAYPGQYVAVADGTSAKPYFIQATGTSYSIKELALMDNIPKPADATASVSGLVKLGSDNVLTGTLIASASSSTDRIYAVQINDDGNMCVRVPWTDNNTIYSAGTGLSKSGTTFSAKLGTSSTVTDGVPVGVNSAGNLYADMSGFSGCEGKIYLTGKNSWYICRGGTSYTSGAAGYITFCF